MNTNATTTTAGVNLVKDAEDVATLRCYGLTVWHKPETPFDEAALRLAFSTETGGFISLKEVRLLVEHFTKVVINAGLGLPPNPAEIFSYRMLKEAGVFEAFAALER